MKKLLVLALSAVLVLSMAAVSMAAVTLSGEVVAKYDFENAVDFSEGKIAFDGKVNDAVTAKIVYKYASDKASLFVDEYWFNVAGDMGALKVGKFGYGTSGKKDILDGTYKDLKAEAAMNYTYTADAITLNVWYAADANGVAVFDEDVDDNGFSVGLQYATDTFGVNLNYLDLTEVEDGFTVNAWIVPMDSLTAYLHAGNRETGVRQDTWLVGALWTGMDGALSLRGEFANYDDGTDEDWWGFAAEYKASNGLAYKYTRKAQEGEIQESSFKVTCAF